MELFFQLKKTIDAIELELARMDEENTRAVHIDLLLIRLIAISDHIDSIATSRLSDALC